MTLKSEFDELLEYNGVDSIPTHSLMDLVAELRQRAANPAHPDSALAQATLEFLSSNEDFEEALGTLERGEVEEFLHDGTGHLNLALELILTSIEKLEVSIQHPIHFDTFPTADFNAMAIGARTGILCLLNHGVSKLVFAFGHALSYKFVENESTESEKEMLALALLTKCIATYIESNDISVYIPNSHKIHQRQMDFANAIAVAIKCFIVAHEIGHVVCGHVSPNPSWHPSDLGLIAHFSSHKSNVCHQNEFAADQFAQKALNATEDPVIMTGGLCTLYLLLSIGVVNAKIKGFEYDSDDESESHPATLERIERVRKDFLSKNPNKFSTLLALEFESAFKGLQKINVQKEPDGLVVTFEDTLSSPVEEGTNGSDSH